MPTMCAATRVCTVPDGRSSSSCRAGGGGAELGGAPPTPRRRNAASAVRNPRGAATAANTRINTPANGTVNRAYPATVNTPNAPSHHQHPPSVAGTDGATDDGAGEPHHRREGSFTASGSRGLAAATQA